jgi:hypothetical protein
VLVFGELLLPGILWLEVVVLVVDEMLLCWFLRRGCCVGCCEEVVVLVFDEMLLCWFLLRGCCVGF